MKKVELLSPAGDFECLKAAINNGADAVYFGGTSFSARKFATNFTFDEIKEAVKYAHLRFKKVYITINTLLDDDEIEEAMDLVSKYYSINVDALIIQDLGLYYRIKMEYPDFEIHASTQMHIHNLSGVKTAKELGFKRVIIARESSLDQIKEFCKEDIEIECFVHGAICVSYSGQCLMSSFIKNRSANRGECAQMCRMKYQFVDDSNRTVNSDYEYLLSPKDMMLIKDIPSLINAGISSFKIEGRLKSAAYVGFVTKIYRQAIEAYYNNESFTIDSKTMDNLKVLFNRGYSSSYLKNNNDDLFNNDRPNNIGIEIGNVVDYKNSNVFIKLKKELKLHDAIRVISGNDDTGTEIFELFINNKRVEKGNKGDIVNFRYKYHVNRNDIVLKTQDKSLEKEILDYKLIKNSINLKFDIKVNDNIKIECNINNKVFNYESKLKPEKAINSPLTKKDIIKQFNKTDLHPYIIDKYDIKIEDCFINLKNLNDIRRDFYNKLDEFILNDFNRPKLLDNNILNLNIDYENSKEKLVIENGKYDRYLLNPIVNIESKYNDDYNIVSELGGLLLKGNKIGFYSLNIYNSYAYELLLKLGFKKIVISSELNDDLIEKLIKTYYSRNKVNIKPYVLTKGLVNLMNIYKGIFSNDYKYIKDFDNKYIIKRYKDYTAIQYDIYSLNKHKKNNLFNEINIT